MRGDATASRNPGAIEGNASSVDRAVNHFMIAVRSGCEDS